MINKVLDRFETLAIPYHGMMNTPNTIGLFDGEARRLLWAASKCDPSKTWVNIGSHNGGSDILLCLLNQEMGNNGQVVSVDLKFSPFFRLNMSRIFSLNPRMLAIDWPLEIHSSNFASTFKDCKSIPCKDISLAFIDGFHSFRQVVEDTKQLMSSLTKGAIVCYHDLSPNFNNADMRNKLFSSRSTGRFADLFKSTQEDFLVDEAICYIVQNLKFEYANIPIEENRDYRQQAGRSHYVAGETSPFNSLHALVYNG